MAAASRSTAKKAKGAALRYGCRSNLPRRSGRTRPKRHLPPRGMAWSWRRTSAGPPKRSNLTRPQAQSRLHVLSTCSISFPDCSDLACETSCETPSDCCVDKLCLVVCLSSRRTKPFSRQRVIGRCPLATSAAAAVEAPQLLQLRRHTGALLLSLSLRIRLRVLLLFGTVVRLLSHWRRLLRLERITPLSPLKIRRQ